MVTFPNTEFLASHRASEGLNKVYQGGANSLAFNLCEAPTDSRLILRWNTTPPTLPCPLLLQISVPDPLRLDSRHSMLGRPMEISSIHLFVFVYS